MTHIFIIHSNVTALIVNAYIEKILSRAEECLILCTRNYVWPFKYEGVKIEDISELETIMQTSKMSATNVFSRIYNRITVDLYLFSKAKKIVDDSEFYLYTPHLDIILSRHLISLLTCKGHFFIEEGDLSYGELDVVNSIFKIPFTRRLLYMLLGIRAFPILGNKGFFKGTLSISEKAFPWNRTNKIIVNIKDLCLEISPIVNNVIILGHLNEDICLINSCIETIVEYTQRNLKGTIGLKFHPASYFINEDKVQMITERWSAYIQILPQSYIVEYLLLNNKSSLFHVLYPSSLCRYAKYWGAHAFIINKDLEIVNNLSS